MVPTWGLAGCAREALMKSWSVLNSESAPVAKTRSNAPMVEIVAKSFTGSNGSALDGRAYRCAVRDETDRVTVGYLREHRARRRNAAWSRLILHHEPLSELIAELLGRHESRDVCTPHHVPPHGA